MDTNERIRELEVKVEDIRQLNSAILQELKDIHAAQQQTTDELMRYKGFLGGVAFLVSCLGAAVGIAFKWLEHGAHK